MPGPLSGVEPSLYRLDRWSPLNWKDKELTRNLSEIHLEWIPTSNDDVIYGLERWGAMIPGNYQEWFAIIVLRHVLIPPTDALALAESANPVGFPGE